MRRKLQVECASSDAPFSQRGLQTGGDVCKRRRAASSSRVLGNSDLLCRSRERRRAVSEDSHCALKSARIREDGLRLAQVVGRGGVGISFSEEVAETNCTTPCTSESIQTYGFLDKGVSGREDGREERSEQCVGERNVEEAADVSLSLRTSPSFCAALLASEEETPTLTLRAVSFYGSPLSAADSRESLEATTAAPTPELFAANVTLSSVVEQPERKEQTNSRPTTAKTQMQSNETGASPFQKANAASLSVQTEIKAEVFSLEEEAQLVEQFELWRLGLSQSISPACTDTGSASGQAKPRSTAAVFAEAILEHSALELQQETQLQILQSRQSAALEEATNEELAFLRSIRAATTSQHSSSSFSRERLYAGVSVQPARSALPSAQTKEALLRLSGVVDFFAKVEESCASSEVRVQICAFLAAFYIDTWVSPAEALKEAEAEAWKPLSNEEKELDVKCRSLELDELRLLSRLAFSSVAFLAARNALLQTESKKGRTLPFSFVASDETDTEGRLLRDALRRLYASGSIGVAESLILLKAASVKSAFPFFGVTVSVQDAGALALEAAFLLSEGKFESARLRLFRLHEAVSAAASEGSTAESVEASEWRLVLLSPLSQIPENLFCLEDATALRGLRGASSLHPESRVFMRIYEKAIGVFKSSQRRKSSAEERVALSLLRWFAAKTLSRFALASEDWSSASTFLRVALKEAAIAASGEVNDSEEKFLQIATFAPPPEDSLLALNAHLMLQQNRAAAAAVSLQLGLFRGSCFFRQRKEKGQKRGAREEEAEASACRLFKVLLESPEKVEETVFVLHAEQRGAEEEQGPCASFKDLLDKLLPSREERDAGSLSISCQCGCVARSARWRQMQAEVFFCWAQSLLPQICAESSEEAARKEQNRMRAQQLLADSRRTVDALLSLSSKGDASPDSCFPLPPETKGAALGVRSLCSLLETQLRSISSEDFLSTQAEEAPEEERLSLAVELQAAVSDAREAVALFADAQSRARLACLLLASNHPHSALRQVVAALEEPQVAYTAHVAGGAAVYAALAAEALLTQVGKRLLSAAGKKDRDHTQTREAKLQSQPFTPPWASSPGQAATLSVACFALERLVESALNSALILHPQLRSFSVGKNCDFRTLAALPLTEAAARTLRCMYTRLKGRLDSLKEEGNAVGTGACSAQQGKTGEKPSSSSQQTPRSTFRNAISSVLTSGRAALAALAATSSFTGETSAVICKNWKTCKGGEEEKKKEDQSASPPHLIKAEANSGSSCRVPQLPSESPHPRAPYFASSSPPSHQRPRDGGWSTSSEEVGVLKSKAALPSFRTRRGSPQCLNANLGERLSQQETFAQLENPPSTLEKVPGRLPLLTDSQSTKPAAEHLTVTGAKWEEESTGCAENAVSAQTPEAEGVSAKTSCGPTLLQRHAVLASPQTLLGEKEEKIHLPGVIAEALSCVAPSEDAKASGDGLCVKPEGGGGNDSLTDDKRKICAVVCELTPGETPFMQTPAQVSNFRRHCQQQFQFHHQHHHQQQHRQQQYQEQPLYHPHHHHPQQLLHPQQLPHLQIPHLQIPQPQLLQPPLLSHHLPHHQQHRRHHQQYQQPFKHALHGALPVGDARAASAAVSAFCGSSKIGSPSLLPNATSRVWPLRAPFSSTAETAISTPRPPQQHRLSPLPALPNFSVSPPRALTTGIAVPARCTYTRRDGAAGVAFRPEEAESVFFNSNNTSAAMAATCAAPSSSPLPVVGFGSCALLGRVSRGCSALSFLEAGEVACLQRLLHGVSPQPAVFASSQLRCLYEIGRGGFSSVWVGEVVSSESENRSSSVALKFMRLCTDGGSLSEERLAVRGKKPQEVATLGRLPTIDAVSIQEARQEIALLSALRSPHFVKLFGVALAAPPFQELKAPENQLYVHLVLVMELCGGEFLDPLVGVRWRSRSLFSLLFCGLLRLGWIFEGGSLYSLLHEWPRAPHGQGRIASQRLSFSNRVKLALEISAALTFLHSHNPPILHRDVKSLNVVLSASGEAKLCDLGMAALALHQNAGGNFSRLWTIPPAQPSSGVQTAPPKLPPAGSPRYMPPEVTAGGRESLQFFAEATYLHTSQDVWSLGCLLIEVFGGPLPYHECETYEDIYQRHRNRRLPDLPRDCHPKVTDILLACLAFKPEQRPSAAQVYMELQLLASSMQRQL